LSVFSCRWASQRHRSGTIMAHLRLVRSLPARPSTTPPGADRRAGEGRGPRSFGALRPVTESALFGRSGYLDVPS
jgi:hypothetical protein